MSELTLLEPRLHPAMAVADVPGARSKAFASLNREDSTAYLGRRFWGIPRTPLQNKRIHIHLRGRYRTGSRNIRCKGGSRRGIPR